MDLGATQTASAAAKKKKKQKRCKVKRVRGKRVRVCKKRKKRTPSRPPQSQPPSSTPAPPAGGGGGSTPPPAPSGPSTEDSIVRFRRAMTGSRFYSVQASTTSSGSSSTEDAYDFCDGTYAYRRDYSAYSGNAYQKGWRGTWQVVEAKFNPEGTIGQARVAYTTEQFYAYVNGANDTSEQPPPQSGEVIVTLVGQSQGYIGEQEFTRSASSACG